MADQPEKRGQPPRLLVTERTLEVEEWCLNVEMEIEDDDPNPPPIRGRPGESSGMERRIMLRQA